MNLSKELVQKIKQTVHQTEPGAEIILFGSFARGDNREDSDIDLLILIDDNMSDSKSRAILYPLFDLGLQIGEVISPVIRNKKEWELQHQFTSLYYNITREGKKL
jgi:uncharacterized protein